GFFADIPEIDAFSIDFALETDLDGLAAGARFDYTITITNNGSFRFVHYRIPDGRAGQRQLHSGQSAEIRVEGSITEDDVTNSAVTVPGITILDVDHPYDPIGSTGSVAFPFEPYAPLPKLSLGAVTFDPASCDGNGYYPATISPPASPDATTCRLGPDQTADAPGQIRPGSARSHPEA